MSPAFPARRRAEQFDALVEGTSTQPLDPALGELMELVGAMRSAPRVEARPEFVVSLRERLMLAAPAEMASAKRVTAPAALAPRRGSRDRRLATALGGFALVGATASMAVAAQHALPGDQLYPMKRAMENAHASLSHGNDGKGTTLLANASDRLDEVAALTDRDHSTDPAVISDTLTAFTTQATQASNYLIDAYNEDGNQNAINDLASFTQHSADALSQLAPEVPADAKDALAAANRTIARIHQIAVATCPDCNVPLLVTTAQDLVKHPVTKHPTVGITVPSDQPSSPVHVSVPPAVHPSASADPTNAPTAPATTTSTPTAPATNPPNLFPTSSADPSQAPGNGGGNGGGSGHPIKLPTGGVNAGTTDPVTAITDAVGAVTDAVSGAVTGLLSGGSPAAPSSSSSPSPTASPSPTKHHHHHHQGGKD